MSKIDKALASLGDELALMAEDMIRQREKRFTLANLEVKTKNRERIYLTDENLNDPQKEAITHFDLSKPLRNQRHLFLKPRQIGMSTFICAVYFLDTLNNPNTNTVTIAHEKETAQNLLNMCKTFHACLGNEVPKLAVDNETTIGFSGIGSQYQIGTAKNIKFGRGFTFHNFHGSEVAFWDNPAGIMAGVMESVPIDGNVILESTANGIGNYFEELYWATKAGDTEYVSHFYPWFMEQNYRIQPGVIEPQGQGKYGNEIELAEKYNLDDEQLQFRRVKINGKLHDGVKLYKQEYPANENEAFQGTGESMFDEDGLAYLTDLSVEASFRVSNVPGKYDKIRELRNDEFELFERPSPFKKYLVTCDPSEGLDDEGNHDLTSFQVIDIETFSQVCHISTRRLSPEATGKVLAELGQWYNWAEVMVERNNHGHAVLQSLISIASYPRNLVYHHKDTTKKGIKREEPRPGFPSSVKTKVQYISALKALIEEKTFTIYSGQCVNQLKKYRKLPNGKMGCPKGSHDDDVSSLGLAAFRLTDGIPARTTRKLPKSNFRVIKGHGGFGD